MLSCRGLCSSDYIGVIVGQEEAESEQYTEHKWLLDSRALVYELYENFSAC